MRIKNIIPTSWTLLLIILICFPPSGQAQDVTTNKSEPHRYGGWFCPDNFGFVPVDVQKLDEVPAISNRLPTQEELSNNMSLINVDKEKHPDARALEMELPRVARIYSNHNDMNELIIVIQAIIVNEDTVVGYRFPNGGNGSAWLSDVSFLSDKEVSDLGSLPFFYSKTVMNASKEEIWNAISKTEYFKTLGKQFDKEDFFSSEWTAESRAHLSTETKDLKAVGFVGTLFGNAYLHIDYDKDGFHYSEKLLMIENHENDTTELFFASGPFPENYKAQKTNLNNWIQSIKKASEGE